MRVSEGDPRRSLWRPRSAQPHVGLQDRPSVRENCSETLFGRLDQSQDLRLTVVPQ